MKENQNRHHQKSWFRHRCIGLVNESSSSNESQPEIPKVHTTTIDDSWFINNEHEGIGENFIIMKFFILIFLILIFSNNKTFFVLIFFKTSPLWKIRNCGVSPYLLSTRLFYANRQIINEKGIFLCSSQVRNCSFSFTETILGKILNFLFGNQSNLDKEKVNHIARAQTKLFNVLPPCPKKPTHNIFTLEWKILHNIIQRCLPQEQYYRPSSSNHIIHHG